MFPWRIYLLQHLCGVSRVSLAAQSLFQVGLSHFFAGLAAGLGCKVLAIGFLSGREYWCPGALGFGETEG